jgi:4-amino-4-deoxy-L-arabinose transferase-like glycosyltransferase
MIEYLFILKHYLVLALFLGLSYILGYSVMNKTEIEGNAGKLFVYPTIGLGILIVVLFLAALFSLFFKPAIAVMLAAILITCFIRRNVFRFLTDLKTSALEIPVLLKDNWHWVLPLTILIAPMLLLPLYPPVWWDETLYHLPYARFYVEHHGLALNPYIRFPLNTHNIDLLYSLSLLFYDDILAHLFHASFAFLTALGIYSLGKMVSGRRTGVIAAMIFLLDPNVLHLMKTSYVDLGFTAFVFLSFYGLIMWSRSGQNSWLYIVGFASGIAAGSKYIGIMLIPIYAAWIVIEGRKISPVIKYLSLAVIFGSPWLIRNYIVSGNPIFPLGGNIFGYSWLWSKADSIDQINELTWGLKKDLSSLLHLPLDFIYNIHKFREYIGRDVVPWGMIPVFPAFLMFGRFNRFGKKLCIFVYANILFWFFSTQILRYLVYLFPMMALLSALVLVTLFSFVHEKLKIVGSKFHLNPHTALLARTGRIAAIAIVFVFFAYLRTPYMQYLMNGDNTPLPVTRTARQEYIANRVTGYRLLQIANKEPSSAIYQIGFENAFYFAKGKIIGDWFGPARYSLIVDVYNNTEKLYNTLASMHVQLFLVNNQRIYYGKKLTFDNDFARRFELIGEDESGALYRLKGTSAARS